MNERLSSNEAASVPEGKAVLANRWTVYPLFALQYSTTDFLGSSMLFVSAVVNAKHESVEWSRPSRIIGYLHRENLHCVVLIMPVMYIIAVSRPVIRARESGSSFDHLSLLYDPPGERLSINILSYCLLIAPLFSEWLAPLLFRYLIRTSAAKTARGP